MAMRIQKGIVKYKDRNDIVCTYGISDKDVQYYFMDNGNYKTSNGSYVASTALVEAIDPMVKASHIGLVSKDGEEVIPFENKSIKPVGENTLIVEGAVPTTQSVIDAINLRNDPLSATKLVSTPATIKEKINKKMGAEGRYLCNDQFSEATVCDINGNNIINNEKYSFIAIDGDKLYMSKNTIDSDIVEHALMPVATQTNEENTIDVANAQVNQQVIENALESGDSANATAPAIPVVDEGSETVENVAEETSTPVAEESQDVSVPAAEESSEVAPEQADEVANTVEGEAASDNVGEIPVAAENSVSDNPDTDDIALPVVEEEQGETVASTEEDMKSEEIDATTDIAGDAAPTETEESEAAPVAEEEKAEEVTDTTADIAGDAAPTETEESEVAPVAEEEKSEEVTDTTADIAGDAASTETEGSEAAPVAEEEKNEEVTDTKSDDITASTITDEAPIDTVSEGGQEIVDSIENVAANDEVKSPESDSESESVVDADESNDIEEEKEEDITTDVFENEEEKTENDVKDEAASDDVEDSSEESDIEDEKVEDKDEVDDKVSDETQDEVVDEEKDESESKDIEDNDSKEDIATDKIEDDIDVDKYFKDSTVKADKIDMTDDYMNQFNSYGSLMSGLNNNDTIMTDVARSFEELIKQNKTQRDIISQYKTRFETVETQNRVLSGRCNEQVARVELLTEKIKEISSYSGRVDAKNKMLESRVHALEKELEAKEKELSVIRPQLEGKQDLVKLLADAKLLLGNDNTYSYEDDSTSYYGKVA